LLDGERREIWVPVPNIPSIRGFRLPGMTEPTRRDIEPFAWLVERLIWHGDGYRDGETFKTHGVVYVPDLYEARSAKKKEVKPSGPP